MNHPVHWDEAHEWLHAHEATLDQIAHDRGLTHDNGTHSPDPVHAGDSRVAQRDQCDDAPARPRRRPRRRDEISVMGRVVVGVDGSPGAAAGLAQAIHEAQLRDNAVNRHAGSQGTSFVRSTTLPRDVAGFAVRSIPTTALAVGR